MSNVRSYAFGSFRNRPVFFGRMYLHKLIMLAYGNAYPGDADADFRSITSI